MDRLVGAIEAFKATGARLRLPYYLALLADACLRSGAPERGLTAAEEGLSLSRESSERWWDAELHRLRGELLLATGAEEAEVEAALRRALEIARGQQARSLELRAAQSLAGLWARSGRVGEAKALLEPVLGTFTEGAETPDLRSARDTVLQLRGG